MNTKIFGKTLLALRKKKGLTQSELAELLNISDKTVSKWETGCGYPEITQLPSLARIFDTSIDFFFKEETSSIAIAGYIVADIVNAVDKYPDESMFANVLSSVNAVGGCVPNTAISIAKIDPDLFVSAIGKVGNDDHGKFLVSEMNKYGVDTSRIKTSYNTPTATSNVMQDMTTGTRTFFLSHGANAEFDIDDVDIENLDCSIFHIGYVYLLNKLDSADSEYGTRMARLLKAVSDKGIKTSIDAISSEDDKFAETIIPSLKYCNYVIFNEIEACSAAGISPRNADGSLNTANVIKAMEKLVDFGVKEKVIVHSTEAGFLMNKDKSLCIVPSLQLPPGYIKGSVGAGDSYAAGCLYGLYNRYEDKYLLEFASAVSASNLSEADSVSGIKPKAEIEKIMKNYDRQSLEGIKC